MKFGDKIDIPPSDVNDQGDAIYCKEIIPENQLENAVIAQLMKPLIDDSRIVWATDDRTLSCQLRDSRQMNNTIDNEKYVYTTAAFMNCGGLLGVELVPVVPANTPEGVYPEWVGVLVRVQTKTGVTYSSLLPQMPKLTKIEMRGEKFYA